MGNNNQKSGAGKIGRRDFICKAAMTCCLAHIPFAASSLPQEKEKKKSIDMKPTELGTYCGLYCGACDVYQKRIGQRAKDLKDILDALGFKYWVVKNPEFKDYEAFDKILKSIITQYGQCPTCLGGGGDPMCQIRICCKEKGYQTCAECPSIPCEKIKALGFDKSPKWNKDIQEIKKIGYEQWCQKQQEMVEKGYTYSGIPKK